MSYRGDWYLLRAKFTNDSNFFVHEVGRGRGVLERIAWKLQKCCEGVKGDDGHRKPACTFFWKKDRERLSRLSVNEFKLATNNMLGYDMPRVMLKIIMYCSFLY